MILSDQIMMENVKGKFCVLFAYTQINNRQNLTDINIYLEHFFCGLLNLMYPGSSLVNLNTCDSTNFPGVDLGDKVNGCCYQITATNDSSKIKHSISRFEGAMLEGKNLYEIFSKLKVLIIAPTKFKSRKAFVTNGKYSFSSTEIIDLGILSNEINKIITEDSQRGENICKYITNKIEPLKVDNKSLETIIFNDLFHSITQELKEVGRNSCSNFTNDDIGANSDLEIKKSKFLAFWSLITNNYKKIIETDRETVYNKIQSGYSEDDQIRLREFLKLESNKHLHLNNQDPVAAIDTMTEEMINKFNLTLISETEIKYFLYYQLYNCFVFPN